VTNVVENLSGIKSSRASLWLAWLALAVVLFHLILTLIVPQQAWITPAAWIVMYLLALQVTLIKARKANASTRWRWRMVTINFSFAIISFLCILYAEYIHSSPIAAWLNDLLRVYRGLALLLVVCTPEDVEMRINRLLDVVQTILIALIFFTLFLPSFLPGGGLAPPDPVLVNTYNYSQAAILTFLALLAVFTARSADSRRFHQLLVLYLCIGAPVSIWTNHILINSWNVPPASILFVPSDLCLLAFTVAAPWLARRAILLNSPSRKLVFLRLGASAFLPILAILSAMLLGAVGHHPAIGVVAGLLSLVIYAIRSTFSQFQLLSAQWDLESANTRLESLSQRDPLTGLYNRRWLADRLALEWSVACSVASGPIPLSILLIDVDYFKLYNDTRGHSEGDACLQEIAEILQAQLARNSDSLVRYGGEEFIAVLPGTSPDGAQELAHRIMLALAGLALPHPASPYGMISVSIGSATRPHGQSTPDELIRAADAALYEAKAAGRNCFRMGEPGAATSVSSAENTIVRPAHGF